MSSGRNASPETEFSTAGMRTRSRTLSLRSITMRASASTVAPPAMSFFIISIELDGLRSSPPVSKQTPLPTRVTLGWLGLPQVMSISRGALNRVNQGEVLLEQVLADDALHLGAERLRKFACGGFEVGRPHIIRGRIDEIACQRNAPGDARNILAIDMLGNFERNLGAHRLAVARKAIRIQREAERGEPRIMRRIGEAVVTGREKARQPAGREQVLVPLVSILEPEQHRGKAALPRQQHMPAGLRLEAGCIGEGKRRCIEAFTKSGPGSFRGEPDWDRLATAARRKDGMHG